MSEHTYNGFDTLNWLQSLQPIIATQFAWHEREQYQTGFKMHDAVVAAVSVSRPDDCYRLLLEWPHIADDDKRQIAYTRDERMGEANRQVMTSVGKYLRRHFPEMSDHVLRDIVALHTPNSVEFKFLRTTAEMVNAVDTGPYSCMCARYTNNSERWSDPDNPTEGHHPYEVYDPALGWHMAVAMEGKQVTGRALCHNTTYVRTYKAVSQNVSTTDERLDAWLQNQGYTKERSWEYGTLFKHIPLQRRSNIVAPYIDGYQHNVVIDGEHLRLVNERELDPGDDYYECRNTSGMPTCETVNNTAECGDCEEMVDEDDMCGVGVDSDHCVCSCCRDNEYTAVYGRRGREYYVPNDQAVYVDGSYYDTDYLSDNDIVELADGDYVSSEDACYVSRLDAWHRVDDCVYCEHSGEHEYSRDCVRLHDGEYAHEDDVWCCDHSGKWYLNDEEGIRYETECGKTVHIDYADEYAPTTEGE